MYSIREEKLQFLFIRGAEKQSEMAAFFIYGFYSLNLTRDEPVKIKFETRPVGCPFK